MARRAGRTTVVGLSAQTLEGAARGRPSGVDLPHACRRGSRAERLAEALRLPPTFEFEDQEQLYKRLALVAEEGRIVKKVFYPSLPPDENAAEVLASWLRGRRGVVLDRRAGQGERR